MNELVNLSRGTSGPKAKTIAALASVLLTFGSFGVGCSKPSFSSSNKTSKGTPKIEGSPLPTEKPDTTNDDLVQQQRTPAPPNDNNPADQSSKEVENMCQTLFGLGTNTNCSLPTSLFFGGTYQTSPTDEAPADALSIKNPKTSAYSCPAGYKDWVVSHTGSASGIVNLHMCWKADAPVNTLPSGDCPFGQGKITVDGKSVCSDLPKRACDALDGNYDSQSGRCHLLPMKTVFGGVFESGGGDLKLGTVTIQDPDSKSQRTEFCETPNNVGGINNKCACPTGFVPSSSSAINEGSGEGAVTDYDRLTYCFRSSANDLKAQENLAPGPGCQNEGELFYFIDGKQACSSSVARFCKTVGGIFNSQVEKCTLPREEFFGGAYQVGESMHNSPTPVAQQDSADSRVQYCESPNPLSGVNPLNCTCPTGFQRQVFFSSNEKFDGTVFDREYLCIVNR